ncbi:hypothetical protein [Halalkalibacter lacteus]|uniref:hypothetical protein n=1 Tax=Halalkalibacter lacteus TaxID=3090663 RepID=UPI002FC64E16
MTDNMQQETAYWTYQVAEHLGIADSTLRKWCILLEKNGYVFTKGANDSRAFTEHDIMALKQFQELSKDRKVTKERAAVVVVEKFKKNIGNDGTPPVPVDKSREEMRYILEELERLKKSEEEQRQFNEELVQRLDRQEKYIEESLEKRDKALMASFREKQKETQKQLAATKEEKEAQEAAQKKGFWARVFGK